MDVFACDLTEEDGAAVAELRGEAAELVAGVGHGEWFGSFGNGVSGEDGEAFGRAEESGIKSEFAGQVVINRDEGRGGDGSGLGFLEEGFGELGVGVLEREMHVRGG